ncbi:MAG: metal-dependent transcriptional regulator [Planctomycetota bacterium]
MVDIELSGKLEDYLEAVWRLQQEEGHAHVLDIAESVGVHKSTVSTALQSLSEKELVHYRPYRAATVTEQGREVAKAIDGKHRLIRRFMTSILLLDFRTADANACRIEHALDAQASERLAAFLSFIEERSDENPELLEQFQDYLSSSAGEQ